MPVGGSGSVRGRVEADVTGISLTGLVLLSAHALGQGLGILG